MSLHVPQIHTCGPGPLDEVARGAQRARLATSQREAGLGRWHHRVHRATGRSRVRDMTERRRGERGSDCLTPSELFGQEVLEATWVCLRRHTFIKSSRADPVPAFSTLLASRHLPEESHPPSPTHVVCGGFSSGWELNPCRTLVSCLCSSKRRGHLSTFWPDFVFPYHSNACSSRFIKKYIKKNSYCSFTDIQFVGKAAVDGGREGENVK